MGFTSFGGAGGPGFSPTAFTTTFTDSAYTATPGERVISNGATVTMPSSPTAGDVVLVGRVGSSSVSIQPNGNELIETADVGYIEQDSTVALISDGSDWYAVDGSEFVSAIPDSVVDGFEDGDITTKSADWDGWKGNTGDLTAQQTTVLKGDWTGKFEVTGTGNQIQTERSSGTKNNFVVWAQADGDTGGADDGNAWHMRFNMNVGTYIGDLVFNDSNGNVEWEGTEVLAGWSVDTLYKLRFEWEWANDQVTIIINDTDEGTYGFANSVSELVEFEHRNNTYKNGTRATFIDNVGTY